MAEIQHGRVLLLVAESGGGRTVCSRVFEREGYRVLVAGNVRKACDMLIELTPINVVLIDCRTPVMDVLEFATILKNDSRFWAIPIVLISATPVPTSWKYLRLFDAFLVSPCPFNVLIATVNEVQERLLLKSTAH